MPSSATYEILKKLGEYIPSEIKLQRKRTEFRLKSSCSVTDHRSWSSDPQNNRNYIFDSINNCVS